MEPCFLDVQTRETVVPLQVVTDLTLPSNLVQGTNLLASRVSYDVNNNLRVGIIVTHGDPEALRQNTLAGIDAVWRTSKFRGDKNLFIGDRLAILLLFRSVHPVCRCIYGQTVDHLLHREIFDLRVVICVILMKDRNESTGAGSINASETRIEFHEVGTCRYRKMSDCSVCIQGENRKRLCSIAQKKCPVVL